MCFSFTKLLFLICKGMFTFSDSLFFVFLVDYTSGTCYNVDYFASFYCEIFSLSFDLSLAS